MKSALVRSRRLLVLLLNSGHKCAICEVSKLWFNVCRINFSRSVFVDSRSWRRVWAIFAAKPGEGALNSDLQLIMTFFPRASMRLTSLQAKQCPFCTGRPAGFTLVATHASKASGDKDNG